jgi:hypothetical protein
MSDQIKGALVAAGIGILSALLANYLGWRTERRKWIISLKSNTKVELLKVRLKSYPEAFALLRQVSSTRRDQVTPDDARRLSIEFSDWLYSDGGMAAEASTRGAILVLRGQMELWAENAEMPADFYDWRDRALIFLRRDLDLVGLESYDESAPGSLLDQIRGEAESLLRRRENDFEHAPRYAWREIGRLPEQ